MVLNDHRLLDGSHPNAAKLSVVIFLGLGVLFALMGAAGVAGYELADGSTLMALTASPLYFASALVVAARTDKSMHIAVGLCLAAIVIPLAMADLNSWFKARAEDQATADGFISGMVVEFSKPPSQRYENDQKKVDAAIKDFGYQEPEPLYSDDQARTKRIQSWLDKHTSDINEVRATLYPKTNAPQLKPTGLGGPSAAELRKNFEPYLIHRAHFNHDYTWETLKEALAKRGLDDSYKTYTPDQIEEFKKHAHETLDAHGDWVIDQNVMKTFDSDSMRDEYRDHQRNHSRSIAFMFSWFVLGGLAAAFAGRQDFVNPFSLQTFLGYSKQGLGSLTRKDGTALIRLFAGLGIILCGVGLAFVLASTGLLNRGTGKAVVALVVMGTMLSATALSFVDWDGRMPIR